MISGRFGEIGELIFEIELIAADEERYPIEVLLDTGFLTGWLVLDVQDIYSLGWSKIESERAMQMVRGKSFLTSMKEEWYFMSKNILFQFYQRQKFLNLY
ncbi:MULTISPECIES: hypothetical protein [Nostocales]|uniref:Aspartyl protease n=2 Tax=Nostocales TaxID=1161 RepID=A0ABW8WUW2_9CYAN